MEEHGIGWAVKQLWGGARVRRRGWNGKGMWLFLMLGNSHSGTVQSSGGDGNYYPALPFVGMKTADGFVVPWLCSQTDLLATDWEEVL